MASGGSAPSRSVEPLVPVRLTCEDEGVVAHVRGSEGFASQVCNPVPELIMTCCNESAPLTVKGVANGKFGVAVVVVFGGVWGV